VGAFYAQPARRKMVEMHFSAWAEMARLPVHNHRPVSPGYIHVHTYLHTVLVRCRTTPGGTCGYIDGVHVLGFTQQLHHECLCQPSSRICTDKVRYVRVRWPFGVGRTPYMSLTLCVQTDPCDCRAPRLCMLSLYMRHATVQW